MLKSVIFIFLFIYDFITVLIKRKAKGEYLNIFDFAALGKRKWLNR